MHATKLCHKHVTLTDILAASTDIKSRDFSAKHNIPSTTLLQNNSTDQVADINNVLLQNHDYQPLVFLDRVVKYIGDVGILVRLIGLHPIEFIELKNTLCQEPVLTESWNSLYATYVPISFDTKVITLRIIYSMMQMCFRKIDFNSPGEYRIAYDATIRILTVIGWKAINRNTAASKITLIESIINFAVKGLIPENIQIRVDQATTKLPGARYIKIPIHTILTTMPDTHLLLNVIYSKENGGYRFIRTHNNTRGFIAVQLEPYGINFNGSSQINYLENIQNRLSNIIKKIHHHQDLHNCILMDKKQTEYDVDTWSKYVINNYGNLYYKGDNCLNIETIADNTELYNNLISLISADNFLAHMANHQASFFYGLLNDGIQVLTEIEGIKNDMFIAFASAHMADILTRCGAVLTEDVFYTVFGIKPTHHHLRLLHRGILLRDSLMLLYQKSMNPDKDNSNQIWLRPHPQEIRISHQAALELLCTYFQGLDKIVKIKPSEPKWLPGGAFNLVNRSTNLCFTNKISLIEYPLPLRLSFIDSIYKSTEVLLNLQKFLSEHKYIGIKGVQLSGPINLNLNSLAGDDLKIFQYFTGYEYVADFKEWVNKLLTPPINDNRLSTLLYLANSRDVQEQFILIMIAMSVSNRDFTLLRREPYQLMKTGFKQVLFPKFDSDIFDKLHDYAQLMSSFLQYDSREKEVLDEVKENLHNTYINIISDNDVLFEVNIMRNNLLVGDNYQHVSDALLEKTKEMLLEDTPKTILDGKRIHLIPYIINTITPFTSRTLSRNVISYTKFYKLSTYKTDISTIVNNPSSSSVVTAIKRSSSYYPCILPSYNDDTTSPKKSRKEDSSTHHVSIAEEVTISSKSLYTTSSPFPIPQALESERNYIVSLSSKTNNITSEESNNSNYMREQSWLMSSDRSNKICPTEYQQGYNFSTQNTIVDEDYSCVNNYVSENIDSSSTATNIIHNDVQTAVYNYQNDCNNPTTADRIQDDWWQTTVCSFQNASDIPTEDSMQKSYKYQLPLYGDTTLSKEPRKEDRVNTHHVSQNIYSPSAATNQTSNDVQTAVYNYQNDCNNPTTADRIQDNWWQTTVCGFQNASDIPTEDRMQKSYKCQLPLYDNTTLSKDPRKEDRVNTHHVSQNIYSPSTATNQTSNDVQTAVYNYQNDCNNPTTADIMQDDWWQTTVCGFQNASDIPTADIMQDDWLQHTLCDQNDSDSLPDFLLQL